ncbi:LOW QUALITY PROTEIN: hypothetical protein HID58_042946, partial [Brassica napus]
IFGLQEGESHNLHISEGSTPKPSGSRRINSRTSGAQEEISVIAGFQEYTSKITKGKDLRPAKRTINFRTTRPTKFLLPRSCPLDLQGITNGSNARNLDNSPHPIDIGSGPSMEDIVRYYGFERAKQMFTSGCNIYRSSRVTALIPRNLQVPKDKSTGPTGPKHEALESLRFQRRIIRDYEFLHDVRRYLTVVRRRINLHASTKGLVPPEEGMRKIAVFTQLLPRCIFFRRSFSNRYPIMGRISKMKYVAICHRGPAPGRQISLITTMRIPDQEFLLQSGAIDHLQQISIETSDLHQPNLRVLPFIDMQGKDPESS